MCISHWSVHALDRWSGLMCANLHFSLKTDFDEGVHDGSTPHMTKVSFPGSRRHAGTRAYPLATRIPNLYGGTTRDLYRGYRVPNTSLSQPLVPKRFN